MTQPRRKGASRIADIPPDVLAALNEGREETATLIEWLAIDMAALVGHVAPGVGLAENVDALVAAADALADSGDHPAHARHGSGLGRCDGRTSQAGSDLRVLATHTSDMVRAWAAYSVTADPDVPLDPRLQIARRFAADRSHAVRECAWDSYRQHLVNDLGLGINLLRQWVVDEDPNIRRCAVESTRPMGVWTAHIPALKSDPALGLPLLEPVRSDPSRYVQNAVANWLNDASKTHPDWVINLTDRWLRESPTAETTWIVNRALRTLRKQGLTT